MRCGAVCHHHCHHHHQQQWQHTASSLPRPTSTTAPTAPYRDYLVTPLPANPLHTDLAGMCQLPLPTCCMFYHQTHPPPPPTCCMISGQVYGMVPTMLCATTLEDSRLARPKSAICVWGVTRPGGKELF